jgi:general secretion pathway protein A
MYLNYYGFREKPFNLTPDPRFVFLSKNHREAFAHLTYGINNRTGFIALTGEVGSGKTTVLRSLLSQLDAEHYRTALIFNPCLSPSELLQSINREFGIPARTSNISELLDALNTFLLQQKAEGRIVVLAIDEVQNLETKVLEQIRLISNLETDREKLIQIVLSGQPEFVQILKKKEMRQLSQRITVQYHLKPMDFEDTVRYINHRLEVAGGRGGSLFMRTALKRIYRYSRGLPRLINAACDRVLLAGYTKDKAVINSRIASAGIKDMRTNAAPYSRKRSLIIIPTSVMIAVIFTVGIYFTWHDILERFNAPQKIEAKEEKPKIDPVITGEELYRAMAAELGKVPYSESIRRAFNNLAGIWNVSPVPEGVDLTEPNKLERAALDRELRLYTFFGNLGTLLRIDYPAVLELTMPGMSEKRFISLVGMENDQFLIDPPVEGRRSLSFSELEKYWSGQGFLLWKDPLNLPTHIFSRSKREKIKQLQDILKKAGSYNGHLTGIYDINTRLAVRNFQSSIGIEQDGIAGAQTMMFLCRYVDRFEAPRLTMAGRK